MPATLLAAPPAAFTVDADRRGIYATLRHPSGSETHWRKSGRLNPGGAQLMARIVSQASNPVSMLDRLDFSLIGTSTGDES